jgi:hypothetical protein
MNHFLNGFVDELEKTATAAGALKGAFGFAKKYPTISLSTPMILGGTYYAAKAGAEKGRSGAKGKYLTATKDRPSDAAFANYNDLFDRKPSEKEARRPTRKYKESAFKR